MSEVKTAQTQDIPQILFSLIACEIEGNASRATVPDSDATLARVCELADYHDCAHLIAGALEKSGYEPSSPALLGELTRRRFFAAARAESITEALYTVCSVLEGEKIRHIPLKGAVIRDLYPENWMRTSGDLDVLVPKEDVKRAAAALCEKAGYVLDNKSDHDVPLTSPSGVKIELHYSLMHENFNPAPLKRVWDHAVPDGNFKYRYRLTDGLLGFYHVAHAAKHIAHGGCGIKPITDLWIMLKRGVEFPMELLEKEGLDKVFYAMKSLCDYRFEGREPSDVAVALETYLLRAGTYGNLDNSITAAKQKSGGKLGYVFGRLFPKARVMALRYPILETKKWLLPIFYVIRWFETLFSKRLKSAAVQLKTVTANQPDLDNEVSSLLSNLGLR